MTIEQLRHFIAVAEREHVTRAAQALHVTQPALSRSIARLEEELGTALFDRIGRVVRLTAQGAAFLPHARRALGELEAGRAAIGEADDPDHGEVSLAFVHTLGSWLAPALIGAYRTRRPDVRFRLGQDSAAAMAGALERGTFDLILTSPRPVAGDLGWTPLITEPLLLAVPPDHRLAGRRRVRLAEVADEPFVIQRHGYGLRSITDDLCRAAGFAPRVAFEGEEVATLRGLVGAGLGVALLPIARSAGAAIPIPVPQLRVADRGCSRTIGLAWETRRHLPAVVDAFRTFVATDGAALAREATETPGE
jgi:LysR family transcriptional activator of glutamate synthase operon